MNDVGNLIISLPFGDGLLPHYKDPLNYRGWCFAFRGTLKKKKQNIKYPKTLWCRSTTDMTKTKGAQTKLLKTCIYTYVYIYYI
jgi:hypothetical protein